MKAKSKDDRARPLLTSLKKTLALLDAIERRRFGFILILSAGVACLEALGVAAVMPFLAVLTNPDAINEYTLLSELHHFLGGRESNEFLLILGLALFVVIGFTNVLTAWNQWLIQHFTWRQNHKISARLLANYLFQPWEFVLRRNTSGLGSNVLAEVQLFVLQYLISGLQLFAQGISTIGIVLLLLAVDPVLAVIVSLIIGGTYVGIFLSVRRKQTQLGASRKEKNEERFKITAEAFGGLKQIKVRGQENEFLTRFREASQVYSTSQATSAVISVFPRYFLEVLAFGAVLLILAWETLLGDVGASETLPLLGLYAFAGFRLLPKMQALFYATSSIQFTSAILNSLYSDLVGNPVETFEALAVSPMQRGFELEELTFVYNEAPRPALDMVNIQIPYRGMVGLVGPTGSGKTTAMDVLLGLLKPKSGVLKVDGMILGKEQLGEWRRQCGYVPQSIFLADDTIAANVAFGVSHHEIDYDAVNKALKIANLDEFIENLPDGAETIFGERGARLSGGQQQRIGIARALYFDPEVLFFDEATSALDNATERAIMDALENLAGTKTIVMIAHRLTTVKNCDRIYLMENGKVIAQGTWDDLEKDSEVFGNLLAKNREEEK